MNKHTKEEIITVIKEEIEKKWPGLYDESSTNDNPYDFIMEDHLDSLGMVDLIMALEERLGITIDDMELTYSNPTLNDWAEYILKNQ